MTYNFSCARPVRALSRSCLYFFFFLLLKAHSQASPWSHSLALGPQREKAGKQISTWLQRRTQQHKRQFAGARGNCMSAHALPRTTVATDTSPTRLIRAFDCVDSPANFSAFRAACRFYLSFSLTWCVRVCVCVPSSVTFTFSPRNVVR